jgi:outer membrane immunogenic protein
MAVKAPPLAPIAPLSWTGLYVGANLGGGWADTHWGGNYDAACAPGLLLPTCDVSDRSTSFVGGGQIGWRWQTGKFVFGVEGSADYARFHANSPDPFNTATGMIFRDTKLTGVYTITGQAGFTWDRSLLYVKGGWAGSSLEQALFLTNSLSGANLTSATGSRWANGWTVGTGWEYRLAALPNLSLGIEYDYMHLTAGDTTGCYTGTGLSVFNCVPILLLPSQTLRFSNFKADISEVLFRANYTFNWAAPIKARY